MFGFLLLTIAAGCAGHIIFGMRHAHDLVAIGQRLLAGYIAVALVTILLGSWSLTWARHALIWFPIVSLLVFSRFSDRRGLSAVFENAARELRPQHWFEWIVGGASLTAILAALIGAWAPSTSWDAAAAHLALPKDYVREGIIALQPGNAYSAYPHLLHALYTAAFSIDGERGPALTHWWLSVMAVGFVGAAASRMGGRTAGWAAAGMLATAPIFAGQAGAVAIDMGFGAFIIAAWAALLDWLKKGDRNALVLAAVFAGSACGIRHTGFICIAAMILCIIALPRRGVVPVFMFGGAAIAMALPWLMRSYSLTGNPVYPFFSAWFGDGPADHVVSAVGAHESLRGISALDFVLFPWQIVMRPWDFDGIAYSPGPWVLIFAVPGVIWGGMYARGIVGANVLAGAALFFFRQYARYFLPFFVPIMAVAGVGVAKTPHWQRLSRALVAFGCVFGAVYAVGAIHFKVPVVLHLVDRNEYMRSRVERYVAYEWANENISTSATILVSDFRGYYLRGRTFQNLEALYPLIDMQPNDQHAWLQSHGIEYWIYPEAYVAESPGLQEKGLAKLFTNWRRRSRFELVRAFETLRRDGSRERVEIYKINHP